MDIEITRMNGDNFLLSEYGIVVQDFIVGSIPVSGIYGTVEGSSGMVDYGADYGQRPISVPFYTDAHDMADFPLRRDKLFELTVSQEPFYVRELRKVNYQDKRSSLVGGKRFKVRITGEFSLDQTFKYGFGTMEFETVELPFAESVATSLDIDRFGIRANPSVWGFGMGLIDDDDSFIYSHTGKSFRVFNAGNELVHPFDQYLIITIRNVQGSNRNFELQNKTTNDSFKTKEAVSSSQIIKLEGPNITSNGTQYLRKTNRQFITLAPGWNEFAVSGASSAKVEVDTRFYYR